MSKIEALIKARSLFGELGDVQAERETGSTTIVYLVGWSDWSTSPGYYFWCCGDSWEAAFQVLEEDGEPEVVKTFRLRSPHNVALSVV